MTIFTAMHMALAFLFTPLMTAALSPLPVHLHSHGSATISTIQQLAGAAGAATFVALMSLGATQGDTSAVVAAGVQNAYLGAGVISLLTVVGAIALSVATSRRPT